ncbi:UbiX family flavin prenyltransferase [Streptomyces ipomoeae]|jgi:4-hydroxy-3-polyprenylbenzoate decarboxylase|uniref:Probable UbiX-like flavin prenyltransferase n=2 Tax=Streptomyces ipomoeae TaxID=103232 RepID=L1KUB8_9ACTN|nr:non-oxidative hydroxyarylic acid decarboxylases subunit B [Streptomyces ipomoeae]EKX63988.1 3-octaprenyl-4-hydroxybenzoate carboxy-lyase [Streptomyces ipomoeae 91-03]MDX2694225.1 non-oxidative hydroxyarylic acid decarboxylases subunit B [Streptomyces ipomoeae]MDX2821709.1 non-oxidative hydroxyarylic acid decarboxylases subunit B [Streptomyces ipomoeae]MDX2842172.1 non-oxidative hydroxyarylic acid decarboxylases subunit B [Streptomyces ipomoeae]MDX2874308.1 non-oxidative hydroxyarylic acid d
MRLVVAITGATGAVLGVRLLQELRLHDEVETHLVVSRWARSTLKVETELTGRAVSALADVSYSPDDQGAAISSGSFPVDGMIVMPCSMKTLAAIRTGYADGLVARAADVTLKERRKLVLVPRETPLSDIHLDNLLALSRMGAVVLPPMLTFYNRPSTVDDMVDHIVARVLDQFGIASGRARRWQGLPEAHTAAPPTPAAVGLDHSSVTVNAREGRPHEPLHRPA